MNVFGVLKQNRSYIFWSGAIFLLGWLIGGLFPTQLFSVVSDEIDHIRHLAGVSYWETIVVGLLPHGIFELTAIFIAAAFGLKLGRVLIVPLKDKTRAQSFGQVWREIARVAIVIALLLVVAAGVEGTITPLLLHTFVKL